MIRYGSSFRQVPVEETLRRARSIAQSVGISRVTEVTYLDRIGIPVFVAIRPDAQPRSVCVSAGKGLTAADARIGAYMEAIELAWAEHVRASMPLLNTDIVHNQRIQQHAVHLKEYEVAIYQRELVKDIKVAYFNV